MKKMVFMAAFVAACAAFVACSNENDLVQQAPDVPEKPTVKYPMTLIVSTPSTRGTDFDADHPLESFYLYSNFNDTWKNGALFEKDESTWMNRYSATMQWSQEDVDNSNTYTFYGINDVANLTVANATVQKPSVLEETVSFGYTMPKYLKPKADENDPDEYYVNYADQVDLLVAKATAGPNYGETQGALNVTFDHALALIHHIYVYANPANLPEEEVTLWKFRINSIKLGGLKNAGVYTFGTTSANGTWDVSTGDDVEFDIPLDHTQMSFAKMAFSAGPKATTAKMLPLTDDGLYLIPQAVSGSVISSPKNDWVFEVSGAYAELEMQGATDEGEGSTTYFVSSVDDDGIEDYGWNEHTSNANGFARVRVPLNFTVVAGRVYNLYIDVTKAIVYENPQNDYRVAGYSAIKGDEILFEIGN